MGSKKKQPLRRFRLKKDLILAGDVFTASSLSARTFGSPVVELTLDFGSRDYAASMVIDLETVLALPEWFEEIPAGAAEPKPAGKVFPDVVAMCQRLLADARLGKLRNLAAVGLGLRGCVTECHTGVDRGVYATVGALDALKTDIKLRHIQGLRTGEGPEE